MPSCRVAVLAAVSLFIMLAMPFTSHAVPASPDVITLDQPNGERVGARVMGDEFQGWVETTDGYSVAKDDATGYWDFAVKGKDGRLVPSGRRAMPGASAPAGTPMHIKPAPNADALARVDAMLSSTLRQNGSAAPADGPQAAAGDWDPVPVSGSRNVLIILVGFNNRALNTTASGWNNTTFSTTPGAKSVANFYTDNSFGALTVSPVTHSQADNPPGIVTVSINQNHPNTGQTLDYPTETAWLTLALAEAANYVDFASYDADLDGYFDNTEMIVYFIPAGYEASGSGKTPSIWAHAWGGYPGVPAGGVYFNRWAINGELNNSNAQHPMGVIAHELGHSMCGLPDLYDTTYTNKGLGAFTVMAIGSWGRALTDTYSGTTPVTLDAWSRQYLGWATPRTPSAGLVSFGAALSSTDDPVKVMNAGVSTTQYFLVENRYSSGWDMGLEQWLGANWGGGLLIQHIDVTSGTYGANDINKYVAGQHQGVLVEEASTASGSLLNNTSEGNVKHLFYSGNNDAFTASTTPNSALYNGTPTGMGVYGISTRSATMTATVGGLPTSAISSPANGASFTQLSYTVTGTATDNGGGLVKVEVSTDGGASWSDATGTASWSYAWNIARPGSYNIKSRATDNSANTEIPGSGINVTVATFGSPELAHYNWNTKYSGEGCNLCHLTRNKFLTTTYGESSGFCISCHNHASVAHDKPVAASRGHTVMVNVTTGGCTMPTYGNVTSGEYGNRMFASLGTDNNIACVTCHNPMRKTEDFGRVWEYTTTSDNTTYTMQHGGWRAYGYLVPAVYRDTSLWAGPSQVKDKKGYAVPEDEYTYDEDAGTITFASAQSPATYIYVTLDYPYLRVSSKGNNICTDCHTKQTHMGTNCMTCHDSHGSNNMSGIRETLRTTDGTQRQVHLDTVTGSNSFADGDSEYDGVCEVCHTTTLYHRNNGSGAAHNNGSDCTTCHPHSSGFMY